MSTKITASQPQPAAIPLKEADASIATLIKHAQAAAQSAPATHAPGADHIDDATPRADETLAALIQGSRPQTTPPPSIDLGLHMDLPDLIRPDTIRDLLDRAAPLGDPPFKPAAPEPQRLQLSAATHISAASLIGAAPAPKLTLPSEIERTCDNLPDALPAKGDAKALARALPGALNAAGLDLLGTDAKCAIALKDTLDQPAQLRAALTASLAKNPAFQRLDAEDQKHVVDAAVKHVETRFATSISGLIKSDTCRQIQASRAVMQGLNSSPQARRAFLAELAAKAPSAEHITRALKLVGVCEDDAQKITRALVDIRQSRASKDLIPLLKDPSDTSSKGIDALLQKNLSSSAKDLDTLERRVRNDDYKLGRVFSSPLFTGARERIYTALEIKLPAYGTSTGALYAEKAIVDAMDARSSSDDHEKNMLLLISLGTAVATGGLSAGVAGALATGAVGQVPSLSMAKTNYDATRIAELMELAQRGSTDSAYRDGMVDLALGVASMALDVRGEQAKSAIKTALPIIDPLHEINDVRGSDYVIDAIVKPGANMTIGELSDTLRDK